MDRNCMFCGGTMENCFGPAPKTQYVCENYAKIIVDLNRGVIITECVIIQERIQANPVPNRSFALPPYACHVCGPVRKQCYCGADLVHL